MESHPLNSFAQKASLPPGSNRVVNRMAMDHRIRVLVVDDSFFMQRRLSEIIQSASDMRVIGFADNGADAICLAERLCPDVITMDINMAKFDGLHAIDYIMRSNPKPIIIISSYTQKGSRAALYGLEMGVIDIVEKPSSGGVALDIADRASEIITKVRTAARVRVIRTLRGGHTDTPAPAPPVAAPVEKAPAISDSRLPVLDFPGGLPQVVALCASTGGPVALQDLLHGMPYEFFPPIVIVQHLPEKFTREFASQLDAVSSLDICEAEHGQELRNGQVYVAPGGLHLQVDAQARIVINNDVPVNHCKPSADVLLHSLARHFGHRVLAFILTGMGEDGAAGALAIKRAGGCVLAQSEATCVVYGMPGAAVRSGGVDHVLSLEAMKQVLVRLGEKAGGRLPSSPGAVAASPASPQ